MPLTETSTSIDGLCWVENWRISNGDDSFVVPMPTLRPVIVVFHGHKAFSYGHYGIHLGQEDRLTFLGPAAATIRGYFIDCRQGSPTLHQRLTLEFHPSSSRLLCIPPGVAHTFDSSGIYSINQYKMYLPEPEEWLSGKTDWTVEGDIINLPMHVSDSELPVLTPNCRAASDIFYRLIGDTQRESLSNLEYEYPFTEDVSFPEGDTARLKIWKRLRESQRTPAWLPIDRIDGAGWARHLVVWTGTHSGYVPLLFRRPQHLIDHGEHSYSHDAFGIHLGGDDHLTFLGPPTKTVRLVLVDCRKGSPTFRNEVVHDFNPSPLQHLIIPRGVAHRFEGLENVFTINSVKVFTTPSGNHEPGNDVIDWPVDNTDYPELDVNQIPADEEYYEELVQAQKEMVASPATHSTAMVFLTEDRKGHSVRVALRKREPHPNS